MFKINILCEANMHNLDLNFENQLYVTLGKCIHRTEENPVGDRKLEPF